MQRKRYVLWLASWYPNKINPFEGDFIQRHARAVSLYMPVTVFHVCQLGPGDAGNENETVEQEKDGLKEIVIYFRSTVTGIGFLDVLIYNIRYISTYKTALKKYFKEHGMPLLVHVNIPMKAGLAALWIWRKWGVKYLLTEHSTHYGMGSSDDFSRKGSFHRKMTRKIFRTARVVINVSAALGERTRKIFDLNEVKVIHNTVDDHLFTLRPQVRPTRFRFIHASSLLDDHKNVSGIIRAVHALSSNRRDFELIIVGPNPDQLRGLAMQLQVDDMVQFTGEISYGAVADQMSQASAFVLFSWYENSPCVIGEALCCGIPVISSRTGGVAELLNASNGILVDAGDTAQLSAAMEKLMNNYSSFNREAIAGKAKAEFSYKVIGEKIAALYHLVTPAQHDSDVS